ncbi:hypothetical protein ACFFX0_20910 [Citricoccus parietis]|uniref:Uncharacterized protein n=1 Tax=Citricoccus parietis TaxID=592307 RepID=A0ABV5G3L6_9MICC
MPSALAGPRSMVTTMVPGRTTSHVTTSVASSAVIRTSGSRKVCLWSDRTV